MLKFTQIVSIEHPHDYKLHLACWNGKRHPLNDFALGGIDKWMDWNRYRGNRNRFNRPYILSFMQCYAEKDIWLYGGVFKVLSNVSQTPYAIELQPQEDNLIGRLKVTLPRPGPRGDSFLLEKCINTIEVSELLKETYSGEAFCGYENINHDFSALETIIKNDRPDWKSALSNVKGIYLIMDKKTERKYIGSAYGNSGLWSRWQEYIETGHGNTAELKKVIAENKEGYARENFRFCLLEYHPMRTGDNFIQKRESFWKEALLSRRDFGYNKN